jgi:hypothetical protein
MPHYLTVTREGGIPLQEWLAFIGGSDVLRAAEPITGVNPFTKEPTLFHPAPGAADFETAAGTCSIEWGDDKLFATVPDDEAATHIVEEAARAMRANIRPTD